MAMCGNPPDWFSGVLTGRIEMITDDERKWLLEGFPINSSTAAIAVPQSKLRELFDCRAENERLKRGISEITGDKSSIFIQELNARYILPSDVAEFLDREREAAKVMREALEHLDSELDTGGDCMLCAYDGHINKIHEYGCLWIYLKNALTKADEIRGGE